VKGEKFNNWRTVGDAEAIARLYSARNVDELMFLDVTARSRQESISLSLVEKFASLLNVPFSVGGGIKSKAEALALIRHGAEKIVLGTSAIEDYNLVREISEVLGSQAVIVALDCSHGNLYLKSGKEKTAKLATDFVLQLEKSGAGEILLQSINHDGLMEGYDLDLIRKISNLVNLPVIASGGCGEYRHAYDAVKSGASAVAIGAMFQFTENTPLGLSKYLSAQGIPVRIA
jgi:imidazole glycerol-phosphate synthase subunit HisF